MKIQCSTAVKRAAVGPEMVVVLASGSQLKYDLPFAMTIS